MARTKGSGFKMKRGPIKDLGSFISGIFGEKAIEGRRQKQRERQMADYILTTSWKQTQSNKPKYKRLFGSNYSEVENNKSNLELITITMNKVARQVTALLNAPIKSFTARKWIVSRLKEKRR